MRGKEVDEVIAHHGERFLRFRVTQKPLLADPRLDRHVAALAETDVVFVRLGFREQFVLRQQVRRFLARIQAIQAVQFWNRRAIDASIWVKNIDNRQLVPPADFEIEFVVAGRDF